MNSVQTQEVYLISAKASRSYKVYVQPGCPVTGSPTFDIRRARIFYDRRGAEQVINVLRTWYPEIEFQCEAHTGGAS